MSTLVPRRFLGVASCVPLSLAVTTALCASVAADPEVIGTSEGGSTRITVGRGSFTLPAGPWKVEKAADGVSVEVKHARKYKVDPVAILAPTHKGAVYVRVFPNIVTRDVPPMDTSETAEDLFKQELRIMRDELTPTTLGVFSLSKIGRGTRILGDKELHFMGYGLTTWTWGQPSKLYLWFPDDFVETRELHGFLIAERVPSEAVLAVTLAGRRTDHRELPPQRAVAR